MDLSNLFGPGGALAHLFAANTAPGAQQPTQPNSATPAPVPVGATQPQPLPTTPPQDYATFIKNLADAAAANIHLKTWTQRGLLTAANGDDLTAARANIVAGAPQAWDQFQAGHTGVQAGQADLGQTLEFLNRFRASQGQTPVDPNNIIATLTGTATPNSAPANQEAEDDARAGRQGSVAPAGPAPTGVVPPLAPLSTSPLPPPWSLTDNAAMASPNPGAAAPAQDPSALFTRLGNAAANGAPPVPPPAAPPVTIGDPQAPVAGADRAALFSRLAAASPNINPASRPAMTAPVVNPLNAQRSFFGRVASAMAGLPRFSSAVPEYLKAARAGLPESTDVNLATGAVSDPISGQPETGDVASLLARRAGAVATAQQVPHVEAEDYLARLNAGLTRGNQANEAGLQRGTDAARIGTENAYKPPTLMRAPDGSVVGVSPTQMAEAGRTGALAGYRPLSEEDTKALGAMGEQYVKDQAALPDVRKTQNTIQTMLDQAKAFPPGTFGDVRASAGRLLTGIGADPDAVAKIVGNPAGADVVMKNTMTLAMDRLKQSFGQAREAGFVLNMAMKANPNIETQPEAYSFMLNTMNQEAQRQADYLTAQQAYRAQHGTIDGFSVAFDQARPIAAYANQALVDTYGAPVGSKFLGRSQGKPVFQAPNGRKFMVQH